MQSCAVPAAFDDLSLEALKRRQSAKWAWYPEDVLPAWVAEMDFPLAEPIREVLQTAVDAGDVGYPCFRRGSARRSRDSRSAGTAGRSTRSR